MNNNSNSNTINNNRKSNYNDNKNNNNKNRLNSATTNHNTSTTPTPDIIDELALPVVRLTGLGEIVGVQKPWGREFLGIPYAEPPLDHYRWNSPHVKAPWQPKVLHATKFGPNCMQNANPGNPIYPDTRVSEDCLYLNVFASPHSASLAPVMVYIHGGGFTEGGGNETRLQAGFVVDLMSPRALVVVTINYRLGIFGYLGSNELRAADNSTGNWGTQDQRMALTWVKAHIHSFGGDPSRIMVAGQSAGAASVSTHIVSHKSFGLFSRATMLSGALPTWVSVSWKAATKAYGLLLQHSNCTNVTCLRQLTSEAVLVAEEVAETGWGPVVDGTELAKPPWELARLGHIDPSLKAIIASNTAEDGGSVLYPDATEQDFLDWVERDVFANKTLVKMIRELYPTVADAHRPQDGCSKWYWAAKHLLRDAEMACPARRTALWFQSVTKTYLSQFDHVAVSLDWGEGASHSSDIPFFFHILNGMSPIDDPKQILHGRDEIELSKDMVKHWYDILAYGEPKTTKWIAFDNKSHATLTFDTKQGGGTRIVRGLHDRECAFWDQHIKDSPTQ
eukprot:m.137365 g.137365  ORF g.137365 m.137365 type:complete len:562 (-) comp29917_c0_seq2:523-2208(-)